MVTKTKTTRPQVDDTLLIEVCHRFLRGERAVDTARWLSKQLGREYKREAIYPLISRAMRMGYMRVVPPSHIALQNLLIARFDIPEDELHVVRVRNELAHEYVADAAARHVTKLIGEIAERKKRVRIGLGGGGTVMRVARELAFYLENEKPVDSLGVHAITSGFDPERPRTAPVSFLGRFEDVVPDIEFWGLFSEAVADAEEYDDIKELPGVRESFRKAREIDIVITSLARACDEHGELNRFMQRAAEGDPEHDQTTTDLREKGWIGDVTYRPYSEEGPIVNEHGIRAVSLFELDDLVDFAAKRDKHVVLVVTPCGACGESKSDALGPLLRQPKLKLWNHLFIDETTAQGLLPQPRS